MSIHQHGKRVTEPANITAGGLGVFGRAAIVGVLVALSLGCGSPGPSDIGAITTNHIELEERINAANANYEAEAAKVTTYKVGRGKKHRPKIDYDLATSTVNVSVEDEDYCWLEERIGESAFHVEPTYCEHADREKSQKEQEMKKKEVVQAPQRIRSMEQFVTRAMLLSTALQGIENSNFDPLQCLESVSDDLFEITKEELLRDDPLCTAEAVDPGQLAEKSLEYIPSDYRDKALKMLTDAYRSNTNSLTIARAEARVSCGVAKRKFDSADGMMEDMARNLAYKVCLGSPLLLSDLGLPGAAKKVE